MLCKSYHHKNLYIGLIVIGILSLVFGVVFKNFVSEDAHNLSMLAGMLSGIGGAFIAIGTIRLIKFKTSTPEKLKANEIELKDERNIQLLRATYTIIAVTSIILFALMSFIFLLLNYIIPAWIAIGCIYIEVAVFFISYKILAHKM